MLALIYDLEIKNAIPQRKEMPVHGLSYCKGWHDHAGMGISVLAACLFDTVSVTTRYRLFCDDNKDEFGALLLRPDLLLVTFNGLAFDNPVIEACWNIAVPETNSYDIAAEIRTCLGRSNLKGYSLAALAENNLSWVGKSGSGADAPGLFQQGKLGALHSYALDDVAITLGLFQCITMDHCLLSPVTGKRLNLEVPTMWGNPRKEYEPLQ